MTAPAAEQARRLALAGTLTLCVGLPVLMAFANRSAPVSLAAAVLFLLLASLARDGAGGAGSAAGAALASLPGLLLALLLAAAVPGLAVTGAGAAGWSMLAQFGVTATLAVLAAGLFPPRADSRWPEFALAGMLATLAVVAVDLESGFLLKRLAGSRSEGFVHNRPLTVLALLAWPVAAALAWRGRQAAAILLAAAVAVVTLRSPSQSAQLGLLAGSLAWLAARAFPRAAPAAALCGALAALAAAPWSGRLLAGLLDDRLTSLLAAAHVSERLAIWQAYGQAALLAPWTGWGFNASQGLGALPALADLRAATGDILMDTHPHHAFLQVWLEFGVLGAAAAAGALVAGWLALARLHPALRAVACAWAMAILSIALVSHGLWQAWWWAAIGASGAMLRTLGPVTRQDPALRAPHEGPT
jgi:O-antigen ligase